MGKKFYKIIQIFTLAVFTKKLSFINTTFHFALRQLIKT